MLKYEWNNILHNYVEKIFITTLESDSHIIKKSVQLDQIINIDYYSYCKILDSYNFFNKLLQMFNLQFRSNILIYHHYIIHISSSSKRKIRRGYLGHLTKIATSLTKFKDPDVAAFLNRNI